jgi:hypothetical protein
MTASFSRRRQACSNGLTATAAQGSSRQFSQEGGKDTWVLDEDAPQFKRSRKSIADPVLLEVMIPALVSRYMGVRNGAHPRREYAAHAGLGTEPQLVTSIAAVLATLRDRALANTEKINLKPNGVRRSRRKSERHHFVHRRGGNARTVREQISSGCGHSSTTPLYLRDGMREPTSS